MHDMYEKGYIDPEIITMDYASFVPKLAQNTVASFYGPLGGMLAAQNATMPASFPGFHVEATVPPKVPHRSTPILIRSRVPLQPPPSPQAARTLTAWSLCWITCTAPRAPC